MQQLNTPAKYFQQGLNWFEQYAMHTILSTEKIQPGKQFNAIDIHQAIKSRLNVNAEINCLNQNGVQYLFEIKLCFNKQLELSNCNRKPNADGVLTNCNSKKEIQYPSQLPKHLVDDESSGSTVWSFILHFISIIFMVVFVFFAYKSAKSRFKF